MGLLFAKSRDYSLAAVSGLLIGVKQFSCYGAQPLGHMAFSRCSTWAQELWLSGSLAQAQQLFHSGYGLRCSLAFRILPDQGSNPHLLGIQDPPRSGIKPTSPTLIKPTSPKGPKMDLLPLSHQRRPVTIILRRTIKKAEHRRIDAFDLWCWRRLLRVPWTARNFNQSILKEISPGCSLEGLMLKLKLQYSGPPDVKSWLIGKDPDVGRDWGQEEKGTTEDEMAGWHHWLNGHGLE